MTDWLEDFVSYHSNNETPPRILRWVAVSTIASVLRRKVWIQEAGFQWTSNFYIVIVAPPGLAKKSTSIDYGKQLLVKCGGINFGPNISTWQGLIEELSGLHETFEVTGEPFETACMTLHSSEFGSLFDADDQKAIDVLTDIWDGKLGDFRKVTKTAGSDTIINPWLNIIGCTTPSWIGKNMPESLIGSGFVCRCIWLYVDKREQRIAYPSRRTKKEQEAYHKLLIRLQEMAELSGPFQLTEEAYAWGEQWYDKYCDYIDLLAGTLEADFAQRRQTHLHKIAMVVSAARGSAPYIHQSDLQHADFLLQSVEADSVYIFGLTGQSPQVRHMQQIIQYVQRFGWTTKRELFRKEFYRKIGIKEYENAFKAAVASGQLKVTINGQELLVGPNKC